MFTLPRSWFLAITSLLWVGVSGILLSRSFIWSRHLGTPDLLMYGILVLILSLLAYAVGFAHVVKKDMVRIRSLPPRAALWHISSPRGYGMIAGMMLLGYILRTSPLPPVYLAGPYAVMGGCLLMGGIRMGQVFAKEGREQGHA
jgi:hypothetical protein